MTRLYERLVRFEARIAAAFLILMVLLIFLGGAARVVGQPLNWTTDAATCLFAWACFLAADIAWRRDSLMSIDLLTTRLPPALARVCLWINYLVISAFLVYVVTMGVWLAWTSRARSFQGIPEVSYSWVTMSMPVGALLLLLTTLIKMRATLVGGRHPGARDGKAQLRASS